MVVVCCLNVVCRCLLLVDCGLPFVVRWLFLFVVGMDVWWLLFDAGYLYVVLSCWLLIVMC